VQTVCDSKRVTFMLLPAATWMTFKASLPALTSYFCCNRQLYHHISIHTHTLSLKSRRLTCLSIVDECKLCSTFGGFPMIVEIHRACNQLIRAWSGQQERSQLWYADEVNGTVIVRYGSIAQRCTGWASYNRRWQSISKLADQWPRCPDSTHPSILQSNIV
jgi:hypothetical protein